LKDAYFFAAFFLVVFFAAFFLVAMVSVLLGPGPRIEHRPGSGAQDLVVSPERDPL